MPTLAAGGGAASLGASGFDWARGLFAEGLDSAGAPLWQPIRFRVQSRQIYVFSHAALLGWYEGASWQSAAPRSA